MLMRTLESLVILFILLLIVVPLCGRLTERRRWSWVLTGIAVALVSVHLVWERYRWQMIPLYGLIAWSALRILIPGKERGRVWRYAGVAVQGIILGLGVALLVLLPVPRMPALAGPYQIGTVTYNWVDGSRMERYGGADGTTPRELMVQLWYPAEPEKGARPERWLSNGTVTSRAMADFVGLPSWLVDQVALAESSAYPDAPLASADELLPVVVYVHGWGGFRNVNQDQLETLASLGYVVASADHAYGALATVYPDGRVAYMEPEAMDGDGSEASSKAAAEALVRVYADDVAFVLDQIAKLNVFDPAGRFSGKLDLERVGIFGHSTGGGAAVRFCTTDRRCQAVLGMDAWVEPVPDPMIDGGLGQPLFIMNSEVWEGRENAMRQRILYEQSAAERYWASAEGTWHYDFVMVPTISPLAHTLGMKGPLAATRVVEINNRYLAAFFGRHLRGEHAPLLDGSPDAYPEVRFSASSESPRK
jgi:predicted dienelactone hydrolase